MIPATADKQSQDSHAVTFTLLRSDLEVFFRRVLHTREAKRLLIRTQVAFVLLFALIALGTTARSSDSLAARLALGGFWMTLAGVLVWSSIRGWRNAPSALIDSLIKGSSEKAVLGSVRLTISHEGVCEEKEFFTLSYRWAGIETIERADGQVLLKTGTHNAFVIPDRAFENEADRDRFIAAAKAWRQDHSSLQTACPQCGYNLDRLTREGCPECGWRRQVEPQ